MSVKTVFDDKDVGGVAFVGAVVRPRHGDRARVEIVVAKNKPGRSGRRNFSVDRNLIRAGREVGDAVTIPGGNAELIRLTFGQIDPFDRSLVGGNSSRAAPRLAVGGVLDFEVEFVRRIVGPRHGENFVFVVVFAERYVGRSGGHAGRNRVFKRNPFGLTVLV